MQNNQNVSAPSGAPDDQRGEYQVPNIEFPKVSDTDWQELKSGFLMLVVGGVVGIAAWIAAWIAVSEDASVDLRTAKLLVMLACLVIVRTGIKRLIGAMKNIGKQMRRKTGEPPIEDGFSTFLDRASVILAIYWVVMTYFFR